MFGRCKEFARAKGVKKISKDCYGYILSEFVWRNANLNARPVWREAPLYALCDLIKQYQDAKLQDSMPVVPSP
eukprot:5323726-Karenia_brevis.AAC.1